MAWVFGHHNANLLLPSEKWKSFLVIHKANLTAKVARCRTAHAYECRKSSENRHGRHRDLGKKIQPHQKKGFDRFALTGWTVTRASKRAGLRIHIYNTWAGGPQKGHEMLCHLHTCLNDQIKKKKNRTEYAIAAWSRTQGTQRELPKVAGFQCAKQGMSLLVQALDYLRTTAYRMQKEER